MDIAIPSEILEFEIMKRYFCQMETGRNVAACNELITDRNFFFLKFR